MQVTSTGVDPHFNCKFKQPFHAGRYTVELEMQTAVASEAQVYWRAQGVQPAFAKERSVRFSLKPGDAVEKYAVSFEAKNPLVGLRFDPMRSRGEVAISKMVMKNDAGKVVHTWRFKR